MDSREHFSEWWNNEGQIDALTETLAKVRIPDTTSDTSDMCGIDSLVRNLKRIRMYDSKFIRPKISRKKTYLVNLPNVRTNNNNGLPATNQARSQEEEK